MELREKDTRKVVAGLECCADCLAPCEDCYLSGVYRCDKILLQDAIEHIKELEREVEYFGTRQNAQPEWISVEDRLPESEFVLCTDGEYCFVNTIPDMEDVKEDGVTHWMPLPEPPKPKEPTFKDVFLKAFPKASVGEDGIPEACITEIFP